MPNKLWSSVKQCNAKNIPICDENLTMPTHYELLNWLRKIAMPNQSNLPSKMINVKKSNLLPTKCDAKANLICRQTLAMTKILIWRQQSAMPEMLESACASLAMYGSSLGPCTASCELPGPRGLVACTTCGTIFRFINRRGPELAFIMPSKPGGE